MDGSVGRPRLDVSHKQVTSLKNLDLYWTKISSMLGVSYKTLLRRREEFQITAYTDLSDVDLDATVRDILSQAPHSGDVLLLGSLRSRGIKVTRERLRGCIMRVDPVSRLLRRRCIQRRTYNVPGANYLW